MINKERILKILPAIAESTSNSIFIIDDKGIILYANKTASSMFKYSNKEFLGENITIVIPNPHSDHHDKYINRYNKSNEPRILNTWQELEGKTKENKHFPIELNVTEVKVENTRYFAGIIHDITPLKNRENQLNYEKEKAKLYLSEANAIILVIDAQQNILQVSQRGCEILKYKESEIVGKNWFSNFLPKKSQKKYSDIFKKIVNNEQDLDRHYENTVVTKYGDKRLIAWSNTILRDEKGNFMATLSVGDDITDKKAADEELKQSESRLKLAESIANLGVWDWNILDDSLVWSDEIYRIFGIDPKVFPPTYEKFLEIVHPEDRSLVSDNIDKALKGVSPYNIEHRIIRPDNSIHYVHEKGTVFTDAKKNPTRMVGAVYDITERKEKEEALLLMKKIYENASEGILITDHQSKIIDVNQAYLDITGFTKKEIIGQNPSISKSGIHDKVFYKEMWSDINNFGVWNGEIWDMRKDKSLYPKLLSINAIKNEKNDITHYVGMFMDISHQKNAEKQLQNLAFYDQLTGLPNRILFEERFKQEIENNKKIHKKIALMFIDLDRFKYVNDTLGHAVGDKLLLEVANIIRDCVRTSDTVARFGGDEFTVVIPGLNNLISANRIAGKIIHALQTKIIIDEHEMYAGASIGISIYPDDGDNIELLCSNADTAMYSAKNSGRNSFRYFAINMNDTNVKRLELENNIRNGVASNEFTVHYQPKMDLKNSELVGAEALLRWNRAGKGLISPQDFIPIAEETNLILPLGYYVLEKAIQLSAHLKELGYNEIPISVNLSTKQFLDAKLDQKITNNLRKYNVNADMLELEITESLAMENSILAIQIMNRLNESGIRISIDDFGTGYSSLSYLNKLPIETLKIDKSFIDDITTDIDSATIASSIISMSKSLGLAVVAEGVETEEQAIILKEKGCDYIQGYYYAKPMAKEEFLKFVEKKRKII